MTPPGSSLRLPSVSKAAWSLFCIFCCCSLERRYCRQGMALTGMSCFWNHQHVRQTTSSPKTCQPRNLITWNGFKIWKFHCEQKPVLWNSFQHLCNSYASSSKKKFSDDDRWQAGLPEQWPCHPGIHCKLVQHKTGRNGCCHDPITPRRLYRSASSEITHHGFLIPLGTFPSLCFSESTYLASSGFLCCCCLVDVAPLLLLLLLQNFT